MSTGATGSRDGGTKKEGEREREGIPKNGERDGKDMSSRV